MSEGGLTYVSPTQVALDCLAGNGRMPAEGEAVLTWLAENESAWRARPFWRFRRSVWEQRERTVHFCA